MKRVQTRSEGATSLVARERFSDRASGSFVKRCGLMTVCVCLTMLLGMRTAAAQAADDTYVIYQAEELSGTAATSTAVEMFFHEMSNAATYAIVVKDGKSKITLNATGSVSTVDGSITFHVTKTDGGVLAAGTYEFWITMTGDGCPSGEQIFKLIILGKPVLNPFTGTTPVCNIANNVDATGTITAGTGATIKYIWTAALKTVLTADDQKKVVFAATRDTLLYASGVAINETIVNSLDKAVEVTYTATPIAYFTAEGETTKVVGEKVTWDVTVQPTARLTSPKTIAAVCDSAAISYIPTSNIDGATFAWSRVPDTRIKGGVAIGTGPIAESLKNTSVEPITVTYEYKVMANTCENDTTYSVTVVVNPTPTLNTPLTPGIYCSGAAISYTPGSNVTGGAAYKWSRPAIEGITGVERTDVVGNITNDVLINTTNKPIDVIYKYTLTAYGCSNPQDVKAIIQPTLDLVLSKEAETICSGATTDVNVTSTLTGGVNKVKWTAAAVGGIITGHENMVEAEYTAGLKIAQELKNTGTEEGKVTYTVTQSFDGCTTTKTYVVTVVPTLTIVAVAEQVICSEDDTKTVTFTSNVTSPVVAYAWEFTYNPADLTVDPTTGVTITTVDGTTNKASGTGAFTVMKVTRADNATSAVTVNVKVTGTLTGTTCTATENFNVTVKPKPKFKLGKRN